MNERKKLVPSAAAPQVQPFSPKPQRVGVGFSKLLSSGILTPYLQRMTRKYLTLTPVPARMLPAPRPGKSYTLYMHIPFCESLCPYCSFNRFLHNEEKARAYYQRLRAEMRMAYELGYRFTSLYIGGGTPTINIDELCETIDLARELFPIGEVSCETNPNHLIPEYLEKLRGRVQRMSVGVQSFDDDLLRQMGRLEKFGSGDLILQRIRDAAPYFDSLNVDMIYNFPAQTEAHLRRDLQMVIDSGAQQTTFYPLMTSPSVAKSLKRTVGQVDYGREARYYEIILNTLGGEFKEMSAWTFLRRGTGMLDEYIVESEEYVGLGSGAFSYLDGALYVNTFSVREYNKAIDSGTMSVAGMQTYHKREQMRYRFMMELFSLRFDRKAFRESFRTPVEVGLWLEMLFMWLAGAFATVTPEALTLTPRGKYLSVVLMREFFSGVNNVRDEARKALADDERSCALPMVAKQLTMNG